MTTKIAQPQTAPVANVLQNIFGLDNPQALEIVRDGGIDGIELWSRSLQLKKLLGQCQTPVCQVVNLSRPFYTDTLNEVFAQASGINTIIDTPEEVALLEPLLSEEISKRLKKSPTELISNDFGISDSKSSAEDILKKLQSKFGSSLLPNEIIDYLLATNPKDIMSTQGRSEMLRHHIIPIRRPGQPNTVVAVCYLPATNQVPVSPQSALDFFIGEMGNYAAITDLYGSIEIFGNINTSVNYGRFNTQQELSVMPTFGIDSSFATQIDWVKLKDGAFISRFSLVPDSQSSDSWGITAKQFEGVVIIRPVEDHGQKGIIIELELDCDVHNFGNMNLTPDAMVNYLMKNSVSEFCMQLVYAYMKSIERL